MFTYEFLQNYWWFIISLLGGLLVEVAPFHIAQDLEPPGLKMVKIAGECQAGPGHVLHGQTDGIIVSGGENNLHLEFFCDRRKRYVKFAHTCHTPLS